jgi:acetyl esterase
MPFTVESGNNKVAREHWFFIGGALAVLVPVLITVLVKKLDLLELRPDDKPAYTRVDGRDLTLHIFHAKGIEKGSTAPALILFHGGGWRFGSPQQFYPQCQFFSRQGITCISAEYRLGPSHQPDITGAIQDAAAAFDYVYANAADLAIDESKIYTGGGSSGGHLAAALGLGMHGIERTRPAALILYNPVLDLSPCAPAHYLADEHWRDSSPTHQMDTDFPRALILSGSDDREVTPEMVDAFCKKAHDAERVCDKVEYAGQHHGFFNQYDEGNPYFDKTNQEVLRFLHREG